MSGHSKWHSIKRSKEALDKKKGAIFTKLAHNITLAAKSGGDPSMNPSLATAIEKAKAANMTKDSIEKAVKKGTGELGSDVITHEVVYEGYGPHGIAMMIKALTENTNRTVAHVRHIFSKYGGSMGDTGSVSFLFQKTGMISTTIPHWDDDRIMEVAMEVGATDYAVLDATHVDFYSAPQEVGAVNKALEATPHVKVDDMRIGFLPLSTTALPDNQLEELAQFLAYMEDSDDIQEIYTTIQA